MRYLSIGGDNLTTYGFNRYVANIIIALIIYLAGFSKLIIDLLNKKRKPRKKEDKIDDVGGSATETVSGGAK